MIRLSGTKMSKSKGNLVAPEEYYETVAPTDCDSFHLFAGPPPTTSTGPIKPTRSSTLRAILGPGLSTQSSTTRFNFHGGVDDSDEEVRRAVHRTIEKVTDDLEHWVQHRSRGADGTGEHHLEVGTK